MLLKVKALGGCTICTMNGNKPNYSDVVYSFDFWEDKLSHEEQVKEFLDLVDERYSNALKEDTIKTKDGKWTNKGKEGTHGKFKTKKEADAQRKAMFANGFHEAYEVKNWMGTGAPLKISEKYAVFHRSNYLSLVFDISNSKEFRKLSKNPSNGYLVTTFNTLEEVKDYFDEEAAKSGGYRTKVKYVDKKDNPLYFESSYYSDIYYESLKSRKTNESLKESVPSFDEWYQDMTGIYTSDLTDDEYDMLLDDPYLMSEYDNYIANLHESLSVGDKFENKNGATVEIVEPTKSGDIQYKIKAKGSKDFEVKKGSESSVMNMLNKNGYKKLNESLNESLDDRKAIKYHLNHTLPFGAEYAEIDNMDLVDSNPDGSNVYKVDIKYSTTYYWTEYDSDRVPHRRSERGYDYATNYYLVDDIGNVTLLENY